MMKLAKCVTLMICSLVYIAYGCLLIAQTQQPVTRWVGAWAASAYGGDAWHTTPTLVDSTLRQVVHTSLDGRQLRVRFTNEFGKEPLLIGSATVAISKGATAIDPATLHRLSFAGQPSMLVPPGAIALSDPVDMPVPAFTDLAVTLYLPRQQISNITFHGNASQDNFITAGDHVKAAVLEAPVKIVSWYFLSGIDVVPVDPKAKAVVTFGDSITDGAWSTENANRRWPDDLAVRLQGNLATRDVAVLNAGISGNCLLMLCAGPNALARFDRDVLAQSGVASVILLESINDIDALHTPNTEYHLTAQDLEQGLSQLATRAHEHGVRVYGATLTPYKGSSYYTDQGEQIREAVNDWIRTSEVFDGVIDFDHVTRDPKAPLAYLPTNESGDHLHPGDAGYRTMANAIPLGFFE